MIHVPVLGVHKDKGIIVELELEFIKQGQGTLFLDAKLSLDNDAKQAIKGAHSLLRLKKGDMLGA